MRRVPAQELSVIEYDPFSSEAMSDPLPIYRELREHEPVYRLERYDAWALSRFEDIWQVYQDLTGFSILDGPIFDREHLASHRGLPTEPPASPVRSFTELDAPMHTQLRQAVVSPLRPGSVSRLEHDIRALARARLGELVPAGAFDITLDYAGPVSAGVICRIVGLPAELAPTLLDMVNRSFRRAPDRPGLTDEGKAVRGEVVTMLTELTARRRAAGAPDTGAMVDRLIHAEIEGRRLTDAEIADQVRSIVNGGSETVPKVVAGGLYELWRHPEQRAAIGADPVRCATAFEEMVRFGGPLQWVGRTVTRDTEIGDTAIKAGQRLFLLIASANRDAREFADPDTFQWGRTMPRHLGFGFGAHYCIGTHVARFEGRILLEELLRRVPDYEVVVEGIVRPPSEFQVGYTSMPVTV